MPKPCLKRIPFSAAYFSTRGTGRGAPPLVQKRRLLRSAVSQLGAWVSIWYMVGTAPKTVTRSRSISSSTCSGIKLAGQDAGVAKDTCEDM